MQKFSGNVFLRMSRDYCTKHSKQYVLSRNMKVFSKWVLFMWAWMGWLPSLGNKCVYGAIFILQYLLVSNLFFSIHSYFGTFDFLLKNQSNLSCLYKSASGEWRITELHILFKTMCLHQIVGHLRMVGLLFSFCRRCRHQKTHSLSCEKSLLSQSVII